MKTHHLLTAVGLLALWLGGIRYVVTHLDARGPALYLVNFPILWLLLAGPLILRQWLSLGRRTE